MMNSSFSFTRRGSREKVKASLDAELPRPKDAPADQLKATIVYLKTVIDSLPKEFNAVSVAANGEITDGRVILQSVVVNPEKLDI